MIACVYGRDFAPFVEPVVRDLCAAAFAARGEIQPITIETALKDRDRCAGVRRLYVLPLDLPPPASTTLLHTPAGLIRTLFPRAEVITSFSVQDLCWDRFATAERLIDRGLPVPETLTTTEPVDVYEFVQQHRFAILKDRFSLGGYGDLIVWYDGDQLVGDSINCRYQVELTPPAPRRLTGDRLIYGAPFYIQRLVADVGPHGITPPQVLRAYIVDHQIVFWTERYRDHYGSPSDWIITALRGARYRFVLNVSEEAKKLAMRSAEVVGARIAAVDIIRTGSGGPYVLRVSTDSHHMMIDRQFKSIPDYREFFDFDRYIAEALLAEEAAS